MKNPGKLERLEITCKDGQTLWVEFCDPEDLTGADLQALRKVADVGAREDAGWGSVTNRLYEVALGLLVERWEIPYLPGLDIPSREPKALKLLKAIHLARIEKHVDRHIGWVRSGGVESPEDGDDDSPSVPAID